MPSLKEISDFVNQFPMGFWTLLNGVVSAMAGLGGALVAVRLTNKANDKRLQAQFKHERQSKIDDYENGRKAAIEEREFELRRDIYLSTVEAVQAAFVAITKMAELDAAVDATMKDFNEKIPAVAKLQLIAKVDTTEAVYLLNAEIGEAFLRLVGRRFEVETLQHQVTEIEKQIQIVAAERDRNLEEMKRIQSSGEQGGLTWLDSSHQAKVRGTEIQALRAKYGVLLTRCSVRRIDFMKECSLEVARLTRLSIPAMLAMRADIGMGVEPQRFTAFTDQMAARLEGMIVKYTDEVKTAISDLGPDKK